MLRKRTLTRKWEYPTMTQIVHETRAMRRFFLSYTLHITSVIFIPLLAAIFLLGVGYRYTIHFFGKAIILDLLGKDPVFEYLLSFVFAFATLILATFLLSVAIGAFHYAKNMFLPLKAEFFGEQVSPEDRYSSSTQQSSYPPKPTSPPPPSNVPSPLSTAYAESSDRARWGPK